MALKKLTRCQQSGQTYWSIWDAFWSSIFHQITRPAKPFYLQQVWFENLFCTSQGISFSNQLSIIIKCFSSTAPGHNFLIIYVDFIRKWSILGAFQNLVCAEMAPKIDQVAPKLQTSRCGASLGPFRETLNHREMPSGLDLLFCLCSSLFALTFFTATVNFKYIFFIVFVTAPKTWEIPSGLALRNPGSAQMANNIKQVVPKWLSAFMKPNAPKTPPKRLEVSFWWFVDLSRSNIE